MATDSVKVDLVDVLEVVQGSICDLEVDAIVNPSDEELSAGGNLDEVICRRGGYRVMRELEALRAQQNPACETGDLKVTTAGNLDAKYIFHAVGPFGERPDLLSRVYRNIFQKAVELGCRVLAIPPISTGRFKYPKEAAANVAMETMRECVEKHAGKIEKIIVCSYNHEEYKIYERLLEALLKSQRAQTNSNWSTQHAGLSKIEIFEGDITKVKADAIVNAANQDLRKGAGVCGAIHSAAGPQLEEECRKIADAAGGGVACPPGEVRTTASCDLATAKHIIHAVGPQGEEPQLLKAVYNNILTAAKDLGCRTVAIPCISTGTYKYPKEKAARIAIDVLSNWFAKDPNSFDKITLCCFEKGDSQIYADLINRRVKQQQTNAGTNSSTQAVLPMGSTLTHSYVMPPTSSSSRNTNTVQNLAEAVLLATGVLFPAKKAVPGG